ncbi:hypothetical protein B0T19DRAFT_378116 [Cercophora scortea]|uniref:Uncharacterized protein n=1 Tax=Cercophora scortea TaxID=314031 RepID=A0AAE0MM50_9PEZI|nr:hypothetical protein B0T19DRAFT_378116 [Cercophora scortea]
MAQKITNHHIPAPRTQLQHNYVQSPITALAFYHAGPGRVFLLAGEDTWLRVYDVSGARLLGQLQIFSSQPIHGLHVSSTEEPSTGGEDARLLVWGAHSVAVLPQESLRSLVDGNGTAPIARSREIMAPDWIYDAILFPSSSRGVQGVLVTAHNEIVPILQGGSAADGDSVTFGSLTSPSRPILYSANLCLLSPDTVLVAGGTAFGEIIVWKYYLDSSRPTQWEVMFVFTGHEGSIFGVSISPELELAPGVKARLLASCSDDRTIRVWDVTDRPLASANGASPDTSYAEARETGFGGNSEVRLENQNDASRCLAVAMGHVSRIWHVKFTGRENHHTPRASLVEIYSFGEDCYRQKWELSLDLERLRDPLHCLQDSAGAGSIGALKGCGSISCHSGKNIWSCAVLGSEYGHPVIATGGADGRIAISGNREAEAPRQEQYSDVDIDISLDQVLLSIGDISNNRGAAAPDTRPKKGLKDAFFLRYSFLSEQTVLATSSSGRLLLGTVGDSTHWRDVAVSDAVVADIKSYNIIKSPVHGTAVLGSASGQLYLFQDSPHQGLREIAKVPGKVSDIICVRDPAQDERSIPRTWTAIVTAMSVGFATMLTFDTATGDLVDDQPQIQLPPGLIVTAAAFCGGSLVLGSRVGQLSIYKATGPANCFIPVVSRKDCKAKDAITCIVPLPGSPDCFLTGCRDGRYRIYTIITTTLGSEDTATLHLQHEIAPPLGMIEGAWFTKPIDGGDIELILHGFRGNNFVVWNESSRQELATLECGGAHRPFDYVSPAADPGQIRLIFTRAAQLRFCSQRRPALKTLKEGGHGREMRAVAASRCGTYVATAAEDTTVRIWQPRNSDSDKAQGKGFKCLAILEKHSAGIQCLRWLGTDYLLSSAGSEELYIWRVTRLASNYAALAVVCEAAYPDRTADGDLRILDFDVQPWTAAAEEDGVMAISLVLSNSTFKTYLYSQPGGFRTLATGHYTGACLMQIRHLRVSAREMHVLTAATDGRVVVWTAAADATADSGGYEDFAIAAVTKLHQSTVKCLDLVPYYDAGDDNPCRWMVVTGGDDNALGLLDLAWSSAAGESESKFSVVNKARVKDAHAAAVTGVCVVIGDGSGEPLDIATVSNDQRVKLWRVQTRGGGQEPPRVSLLSNQYSSVADPGDLEVIAGGRRLMIGGVGAEVWDVSGRDAVLVKG